MSLILDALSRAEREKRAHDGVPDILAPVEAPERSRRPPLALLLAALAIAAVLGAIAYWQWPGQDTVQNPVSPRGGNTGSNATSTDDGADAVRAPGAVERGAALTPTSTFTPKPAPSPITTPTPTPTQTMADRERIAALYSTRASGTVGGVQPESPVSQAAAAGPGTTQAVVSPADTGAEAASEAPALSSPQASATRRETPVDLEQVLREVRRASANDSLSEHPVPVLESLSQQFRDRVPTLMYLRHDYSGDQGGSSVLINGESLRVGQRTRSVQVVEILPDSVILRFDGRDFRLRALNSWVNL